MATTPGVGTGVVKLRCIEEVPMAESSAGHVSDKGGVGFGLGRDAICTHLALRSWPTLQAEKKDTNWLALEATLQAQLTETQVCLL